MQLRAEQVDALAAGDLDVQLVLLGDGADGDQAFGRDLAGRNAGHHGIGAVLLHVGHEGIVGVLQRHQVRVLDGAVPARGQDRSHGGLADFAAHMAAPVAGQQFLERLDAADAHDRIQLLAGVGEVFAQALVDRDAAAGQLVFHHLLEQARAAAATRGGLGATLDAGQVRTAAVDGVADGALVHVVAGTDRGGGGQRVHAQQRRGLALGQNQAGRVCRRRDAVLRVLQQGVVVAVVAHQHGAQHAFAVRGHHQAAVTGAGFVDVAVAARARRRAVRVADGADIHAQQLELGGHVGARERRFGGAAKLGRDDARHLVAGRHQAEHGAAPGRAFADGVDAFVAAAAMAVDGDAAALGQRQSGLARQIHLRPDAGREHDQVGFQRRAFGKAHAVAILRAGLDVLRGARQMHAHAQRFDAGLQRGAAGFVELHRHQARRKLHNVRFQVQRLEGVGGLQPQQAAAHDHAAPRAAGGLADQVQVVDAAIHQARRAFGPGDGRHEGIGAGGQHQFVVGGAAAGGDHLLLVAVDLQHRLAQVQGQALLFVQRGLAQRHRLGIAPVQVFGQVDAVIGAAGLLAEDVDAIARERAAGDQLLDAMVAHHAVADDNQRLQGIGSGRYIHGISPGLDIRVSERQTAPWTFRSGRHCRYCSNCLGGFAPAHELSSKVRARNLVGA
ncbi:hypothetical protein D3C85_511420 [compost metagenome]